MLGLNLPKKKKWETFLPESNLKAMIASATNSVVNTSINNSVVTIATIEAPEIDKIYRQKAKEILASLI